MFSKLRYVVSDFPEELRGLDQQDAKRLLDEAVEAQRRDDEITAYNKAITGRGILVIFCVVVALPALIFAPAALDVDTKYSHYFKFCIILLLIPLRICEKARGRQRLRPYVAAALAKRSR